MGLADFWARRDIIGILKIPSGTLFSFDPCSHLHFMLLLLSLAVSSCMIICHV